MVTNILMYFNQYEMNNIPGDNNRYANSMVNVASLYPINIEDEEIIQIIKHISIPSYEYVEYFIENHFFSAIRINVFKWYQDIVSYLKNGVVRIDFYHNARTRVKKIATNYVIIKDLLYRRYFHGALIRC